jgi:hypothetical protein
VAPPPHVRRSAEMNLRIDIDPLTLRRRTLPLTVARAFGFFDTNVFEKRERLIAIRPKPHALTTYRRPLGHVSSIENRRRSSVPPEIVNEIGRPCEVSPLYRDAVALYATPATANESAATTAHTAAREPARGVP